MESAGSFQMLFNPFTDLPDLILGFGVALFLTLACLLKYQHRRDLRRRERLEKGLRSYVANQGQEVA
jgi:hypothetical protein